MKEPSLKYLLLLKLTKIAFFLVFFIVAGRISFNFMAECSIRPIEKINPDITYLVPVVNGDHIELILNYDLAKHLQENPQATLFIPKEKEEYFDEKLREIMEVKKFPSIPRIEVTQLSSDRQRIFVGLVGDHDTDVWYETDGRETKLKAHRVMGIGTTPYFFIAMSMIYVTGWLAYYNIKRFIAPNLP